MKTKLIFTMLFLCGAVAAYTQELKPATDESKCIGKGTRSPVLTVPCAGEVRPVTSDLKWRPLLSNRVRSSRPQAPDAETIRRIKEEKTRNKVPAGTGAEKSASGMDPLVGTSYMGNTNNGFSPLDNSLAISAGGWIVSVANTTIEYDRTDGTTVFFTDLVTFINDAGITNVCDPVVIYDAGADRFIFFCQKSPIVNTSKIMVFFSKTNNPNDGWYKYFLTGNPLGQNEGFDYPKLAVSNNELYITGNLFFTPSLTFDQAILYQIDKNAGYSGSNMNWSYWHNIDGSPFTLLPVSYGHGSNYGPGCYLVSTTAGGSGTVNFYDLTDDLTGTPSLNHYALPVTAYSPAGDARQSGTSCLLDNGDCRSLSGFYLNGVVHFVFHSDIGDGWNGVNYKRLTVSDQTIQTGTFGMTGSYDYSYPSVASFTNSPTDRSVMINFGRSGSEIYPSVRAVYCDDQMNWSGSVLVKASDNYVSYSSGSEERWGDYTGISRHHGASNPSVWISGSYGTNNNVWNAWNAEIHGSSSAVAETPAAGNGITVAPNPVTETFRVDFTLPDHTTLTVSIVDITGKTVRELYNGRAFRGENTFTFNKAGLERGEYFLVIRDPSTTVRNEKIIIAD